MSKTVQEFKCQTLNTAPHQHHQISMFQEILHIKHQAMDKTTTMPLLEVELKKLALPLTFHQQTITDQVELLLMEILAITTALLEYLETMLHQQMHTEMLILEAVELDPKHQD